MTSVDTRSGSETEVAPQTAASGGTWLPLIEGLRGLAAVAVVIHHSWALSSQPHFFGWRIVGGLGEWGVDLFFLLSAFLLSPSFWRGERSIRLVTFYRRRFWRIAPAYYVNVALLFLFFADHNLVFSHQGLRQSIFNATFMQWLDPNTSSNLNVNGVLWTLTIEILLYIVMPLLAWVFWRNWWLSLAVLIAVGLGWRILVAVDGGGLIAFFFHHKPGPGAGIEHLYVGRQFPGYLQLFGIGIAARLLLQRTKRSLPGGRSALVLLLLLLPSLLWTLANVRSSDYQHWLWFSGYDLAMALLLLPPLYYAASRPGGELSWLGKAGAWTGTRSYSLYLWHFPLILSVYGIGTAGHPAQLSHWAWRLAFIYVGSLALAAVSYQLVEVPGLARMKRIR
jgi:peptidoglycan/LPS O-acetylase OafA/YrhL